jgi:hypothetical protein
MSIYVIDTGTSHFTSSEDYATLAEAQQWEAFMATRGVVGTLLTFDAYLLTPNGQAFSLDAAKLIKLGLLRSEALSRTTDAISSMDSLEAIADVLAIAAPTSADGLSNEEVLTAYLQAVIVILALPTVLDVESYDVVNDPSWPVAPVATSNLAVYYGSETASAATTTIVNNVWTPINCTLTTKGTLINTSSVGNIVTYDGAVPQFLIATINITGCAASGSDEIYRVGFAKNGADPTESMTLATEDKTGCGHCTFVDVIEVVQGDTITPYIIDEAGAIDFDLTDIVVAVARWVT